MELALRIERAFAGDSESLAICEALRTSCEGIHAAVPLLALESTQFPHAAFWGIDAITFALKKGMWREDLEIQRRMIREILRMDYGGFLANKRASLIAVVVEMYYPLHWSGLIREILALASENVRFVDTALRVFKALDEDFIAGNQSRSSDIMRVKDAIREDCVGGIVDLFVGVLVYCSDKSALVELALDCCQRYISWIEIELVVNDRVISVIYKYLCEPLTEFNQTRKLRAADCLFEIVYKKMPGMKKLQILESMNIVSFIEHCSVQSNYDEFSEYMSDLSASVGSTLLEILHGSETLSDELARKCESFLKRVIVKSLEYLNRSHFKVAGELIDFFHSSIPYIAREGKDRLGDDFCSAFLAELCNACLARLPYPAGFKHFDQDDDEIEFLQFRNSLDNLLKYILQHVEPLFLSFIGHHVGQFFSSSLDTQQSSRIEAILHIILLVMTSQRANFLSKDPSGVILRDSFETFVKAGIGKFQDLSVTLAYLDLIPKFPHSFEQPDLLNIGITDLCSHRGLSSESKILRTRSAFVLLRLVKDFTFEKRFIFAPFPESISTMIVGFIASCIEHWRISGFSSMSLEACLFNEDELYNLCEVLGLIISPPFIGMEQSKVFLGNVLRMLLEKIQELSTQQQSRSNGEENNRRGVIISKISQCIGNISKSFRFVDYPKAEFSSMFAHILQVLVKIGMGKAIGASSDINLCHSEFRSGLIFYLQRMVIVMGDSLINISSEIIQNLLFTSNRDLFLGTLNLISQFSALYESKFFGVLEANWTLLSEKYSENLSVLSVSLEAASETVNAEFYGECLSYRKVYFQFLITLFKKGFGKQLITSQNLSNSLEILKLVCESCQFSDPSVSQYFNLYSKI
jgi:exportin-T